MGIRKGRELVTKEYCVGQGVDSNIWKTTSSWMWLRECHMQTGTLDVVALSHDKNVLINLWWLLQITTPCIIRIFIQQCGGFGDGGNTKSLTMMHGIQRKSWE